MPRCAAGSPVLRRVYGCERAVSSLPSIVTRLYLAYVRLELRGTQHILLAVRPGVPIAGIGPYPLPG
jgi:hypothetical protein